MTSDWTSARGPRSGSIKCLEMGLEFRSFQSPVRFPLDLPTLVACLKWICYLQVIGRFFFYRVTSFVEGSSTK